MPRGSSSTKVGVVAGSPPRPNLWQTADAPGKDKPFCGTPHVTRLTRPAQIRGPARPDFDALTTTAYLVTGVASNTTRVLWVSVLILLYNSPVVLALTT